MKPKILIIGAGGSGKDFLRKKFESKGFSHGIHYTTRPKRDGEIEGSDYYYVSEEIFKTMIDEDKFIEYTSHNNWYYGLSKVEFKIDNLFVISMKSYLKYPNKIKKNAFKIFLDIDEDVRRERLSKRNDADSVERRIQVDNEDISQINKKEFDLIIKNEDF